MNQLLDFRERNAHEIDYRIYGEEMQYVEIELDPDEGVIAESGSFMMMDAGIQMETIFGLLKDFLLPFKHQHPKSNHRRGVIARQPFREARKAAKRS